jgi:hypothetical protein
MHENKTTKLNLLKLFFKMGEWIQKSNREGEFNQSTLCACMEISQWNPFGQVMYDNNVKK